MLLDYIVHGIGEDALSLFRADRCRCNQHFIVLIGIFCQGMLEVKVPACLIKSIFCSPHLRLRFRFFHDCGLHRKLMARDAFEHSVPNYLLVVRGVKKVFERGTIPYELSPQCEQVNTHVAAIHRNGANDEISAYVSALRENEIAGFICKDIAPSHTLMLGRALINSDCSAIAGCRKRPVRVAPDAQAIFPFGLRRVHWSKEASSLGFALPYWSTPGINIGTMVEAIIG
jgi:hypothetical protein